MHINISLFVLEVHWQTTVPIIHKFLEKRVHDFAGRVYTTSTFFDGRAWFTEQARPPFQSSAFGRVHRNYKLA